MAHAVDQDITDSYTNVSALREQLREAAETVAAFIVRLAGCNPDAELTKRLRKQATPDRSWFPLGSPNQPCVALAKFLYPDQT
jgi:hypothetical protein